MKLILLALIRLYWRAWPERFHRRCLYRETCSHHVYRIAGAEGFIAGCRALRRRVRSCRPGYVFTSRENRLGLVLIDGSFVPQELISTSTLDPFLAQMREIERILMAGNMTGQG
jgi:hypothetical protein